MCEAGSLAGLRNRAEATANGGRYHLVHLCSGRTHGAELQRMNPNDCFCILQQKNFPILRLSKRVTHQPIHDSLFIMRSGKKIVAEAKAPTACPIPNHFHELKPLYPNYPYRNRFRAARTAGDGPTTTGKPPLRLWFVVSVCVIVLVCWLLLGFRLGPWVALGHFLTMRTRCILATGWPPRHARSRITHL